MYFEIFKSLKRIRLYTYLYITLQALNNAFIKKKLSQNIITIYIFLRTILIIASKIRDIAIIICYHNSYIHRSKDLTSTYVKARTTEFDLTIAQFSHASCAFTFSPLSSSVQILLSSLLTSRGRSTFHQQSPIERERDAVATSITFQLVRGESPFTLTLSREMGSNQSRKLHRKREKEIFAFFFLRKIVHGILSGIRQASRYRVSLSFLSSNRRRSCSVKGANVLTVYFKIAWYILIKFLIKIFFFRLQGCKYK